MAKIVINSSAFFHNIDLLSKKAGSKDKIAVVLKDNAYGHGLKEMATLSARQGIKRAVVRNLAEATEIAPFFENIIVLGETPKNRTAPNISCAINQISDINNTPSGQKIDIKVDTGMHRNGILPHELENAISISVQKKLEINSIFTHYRSADELSSELFWQFKNFEDVKKNIITLCIRHKIALPLFHSCNSAALLRQKSFVDDFARVGIAIYGYHEMPSFFGAYDLKPVMSLWGTKVSTRELKKGSRVGYGGGYTVDKETKISSYDIGYGDGVFRVRQSDRFFSKCGKRALGRASMDYISFEGDAEEVCIFEDVSALTKLFDTIVYDQLVKLSPKITRVVE